MCIKESVTRLNSVCSLVLADNTHLFMNIILHLMDACSCEFSLVLVSVFF